MWSLTRINTEVSAPSVSSCATIARIAAIAATKQTQRVLPWWHRAALIKASVEFEIAEKGNGIEHKAAIKTSGRTGFEMALLTNASLMVLTIYDMAKVVILARMASGIELRLKVGGRSA
jgi:cyclic pyranopterin phosphate synthase